MVTLGGIQLSILEILLTIGFVSLTATTFVCMKRIAKLQQQVTTFQSDASREIKMVNQGAIGLGRRFSLLEARFKKSVVSSAAAQEKASSKNQVSAFELIRNETLSQPQSEVAAQAESATAAAKTPARKHRTQAEQSLSRWMSEQQTA